MKPRSAKNKQFLIDFETEVKEIYESGKIKAPVHLSKGNEKEIIDKNKDKRGIGTSAAYSYDKGKKPNNIGRPQRVH